jgi:SAM-dependent methyltransferase
MKCVACHGQEWVNLPVPGPRSMASDGRVINQPLRKRSCTDCCLVMHESPPSASRVAELFGHHYSLYAHAPGRAFEVDRQRGYAHWILERAAKHDPVDVFEVGCGNGSLLLAMRELLPNARLRGIDPSAEAVGFARGAGLEVDLGFVAHDEYCPPRADLMLCVNVVEHSPDPSRFLESMCANLSPGNRAAVLCPDGEVPSSELLIFDHLFTFTEAAFRRLAARAGIRIISSDAAPAQLGPFRLYVVERGKEPAVRSTAVNKGLMAARARYLESWETLDERLMRRLGTATSVTCFGVGEAALLLRAYAPRTWSRIERFAVDHPPFETLDGLPVIRLDDARLSSGEAMLLAVRSTDQQRVHQRLRSGFPHVVRWDDFISV